MHVYLIGICGTGMGSLATLLADAGHHVSGSDPAPRPPMSEVLAARGIEVLEGWKASNIDALSPDTLVVVGNVCRRDNPEAVRAEERGLERISMPGVIGRLLLPNRRSLVVAGTHGKTTTTALLGSTLVRAGRDPTVLVGGVVPDLGGSSRLGAGEFVVLEGDEYDSAFFEKIPKFWSYQPWGVIIGSVEQDHLDIYPDEASYVAAFEGLVDRIPPDGLLALWAGDRFTEALSSRARCRVLRFGLAGQSEGADVVGLLARSARGKRPVQTEGAGSLARRRLELRVRWPDGTRSVYPTNLLGEHNARNALAAAVLCREALGLTDEEIARGFAAFSGVALRQQLVGTKRSVRVYRDFGHHPSAVAETLRALRAISNPGRLVAAYEPRSATACRRLHQEEYVDAFAEADLVVLAPVGRPEIPLEERLDTKRLARDLRKRGVPAIATSSLNAVVDGLARRVKPGDLVVLFSNGSFGQVDRRLLERLGG